MNFCADLPTIQSWGADSYTRRLVLGWKMLGLERSLGSRIVTYADDLVILCRRGKGEEALARMRQLMGKLKLTVNEEKTRSCKVPEGEFNFLGYTFAQFCAATFLIRAWLRWVLVVRKQVGEPCHIAIWGDASSLAT